MFSLADPPPPKAAMPSVPLKLALAGLDLARDGGRGQGRAILSAPALDGAVVGGINGYWLRSAPIGGVVEDEVGRRRPMAGIVALALRTKSARLVLLAASTNVLREMRPACHAWAVTEG